MARRLDVERGRNGIELADLLGWGTPMMGGDHEAIPIDIDDVDRRRSAFDQASKRAGSRSFGRSCQMASSACCVASSARSMSRRILRATARNRSAISVAMRT
jgi:hypothetical protein